MKPDYLLINFILIGNKFQGTPSAELAFAQEQMQGLLPTGTPCVQTDARTLESLAAAARDAVCEAALPDESMVLLLRNSFLFWPAGLINRLVSVFRQGVSAAAAYDFYAQNPAYPPAYFTVRGLERYVETLPETLESSAESRLESAFPAIVLTSAKHLRAGDWNKQAVFVTDAYAHDFSNYHQGSRDDVIPLIEKSTRRILDVGGGEGRFLELVKRKIHCETHLAEYSEAACEAARSQVDRVWPGDFLSTRFDLKFDCLTFLDVLEHTAQPEKWLEKASELLNHDGNIIASIPNVGHWSVIADLIEGRWDTAPAGIHCITHLRFFTRTEVEALMRNSGLEIVEIRSTKIDPPDWFDVSAFDKVLRVDRNSLATFAFLVVAKVRK